MFLNRKDAGEKLGEALKNYQDENPVILGIPKGGVEVAYYVAKRIGGELSMVMARKLPAPYNPELGIGAMAEDGTMFLLKEAADYISQDYFDEISQYVRERLDRQIKVLRNGEPLPDLSGRVVILVDDGIAMGATMRAAVLLCRNKGAKKIVVAAPVSGIETKMALEKIADDVVILETPEYFRAVAQVYENWYDVSEQEVLEIMDKWKKHRNMVARTGSY